MNDRSSDDNGVDIDAAWAQIIARWDEEAPPREPAPDRPGEQTDRPGPRHATPGPDSRADRAAHRRAAHRADPDPYDYERDQDPGQEDPDPVPGPDPVLDLSPVGPPGPRDVDPDSPSFLEAIDASDDEHYEPPPPPPFPRPTVITALAWLAAVGGPVFLVVCAFFWRDAPSLVVAGAVAAFAAGFVTLVMRMSDHDSDDGAVV